MIFIYIINYIKYYIAIYKILFKKEKKYRNHKEIIIEFNLG